MMERESYLTTLPHDVFAQLVKNGTLSADDLLNTCASSSELEEFCSRRNQKIYNDFLERYYVRPSLNPRLSHKEQVKRLKYSYFNQIVGDYRMNNNIYIDNEIVYTTFVIPDFIIELFAKSIDIPLEKLLKCEAFINVILKHYLKIVTDENNNFFYIDLPSISSVLLKGGFHNYVSIFYYYKDTNEQLHLYPLTLWKEIKLLGDPLLSDTYKSNIFNQINTDPNSIYNNPVKVTNILVKRIIPYDLKQFEKKSPHEKVLQYIINGIVLDKQELRAIKLCK